MMQHDTLHDGDEPLQPYRPHDPSAWSDRAAQAERRLRSSSKQRPTRRAWRRQALAGVGLVLVAGIGGTFALAHHKKTPLAVSHVAPPSLAVVEGFQIHAGAAAWPELAEALQSQGLSVKHEERRDKEVDAELKLPAWAGDSTGPSWHELRRAASRLEELSAGSPLPATLPRSLENELSADHISLTRSGEDYQLAAGALSYSSLEGFNDRDFAEPTPPPPANRREPMAARSQKSHPAASSNITVTLSQSDLRAFIRFCSAGVLTANPDVQSLTLTYDAHHHRGTIWLAGAHLPDRDPSATASDEVWNHLPQAGLTIASQDGFLSSLVRWDSATNLVGHLWTGAESGSGWQGVAIQTGAISAPRLTGLLRQGLIPTAWLGQGDGTALPDGEHHGWSVSHPGKELIEVQSGFSASGAAAPSPRAMWRSSNLPGVPRAVGRFDARRNDDATVSTVSWVAGGNPKAVWVCFEDQPASQSESATNCPEMGPEVKSIHRIAPTIFVGR